MKSRIKKDNVRNWSGRGPPIKKYKHEETEGNQPKKIQDVGIGKHSRNLTRGSAAPGSPLVPTYLSDPVWVSRDVRVLCSVYIHVLFLPCYASLHYVYYRIDVTCWHEHVCCMESKHHHHHHYHNSCKQTPGLKENHFITVSFRILAKQRTREH